MTAAAKINLKEYEMSEQQKLVIVNSRGFDDERSSVAWSIANTAIASEIEVTVFLVASGVDWVRNGASEFAHPNPLDPTMEDMIGNFVSNGGSILVCPPCAKVRGYSEDDLIEGAIIAGAPAMLEKIREGADSLSF
jgi:predicted peroxiredoxin